MLCRNGKTAQLPQRKDRREFSDSQKRKTNILIYLEASYKSPNISETTDNILLPKGL